VILHVRFTPRGQREVEELRVLLGKQLEGGAPLTGSAAVRWAVRRVYRAMTRKKKGRK
jgi:hypothetical protein